MLAPLVSPRVMALRCQTDLYTRPAPVLQQVVSGGVRLKLMLDEKS